MRATWLGWLLTGLAAATVWLAVLRHPPGATRDLFPSPDAPEYVAGAVRLHQQGDFAILVAGERLPSRYPPGYSAVLVPWLAAGVEPIDAPRRANAVLAALLLAIVHAALWLRGRPAAAGLATLLLATTPAFVVLARAPLSDLASTVLTTPALFLLWRYAAGARLAFGVGAALLLGLAINVRVGNVLFAPAAMLAWVAHTGANTHRAATRGTALLLATIAGAAPVLLYQARELGNPFRTGYEVWIPGRATFLQAFDPDNVEPNLRYLLRELLQLEWRTTIASEYGYGSYFGPAVVLLVALLVIVRPPSRTTRWLAIAAVGYAAAMLCYFFRDARFFVPLLPGAVAFAATRAIDVLGTGRRWLRAATATLLILHVLGVPGSGCIADVPRYLVAPPPANAPRHDLLAKLRRVDPGLLLVTFNPPHAHAMLSDAWTVAPANDDHDYRFHPAFFRYGAAERRRQVRATFAAGRPVYLLADERFDEWCRTIEVPEGTAWYRLSGDSDAGIARLTAR
ncbi:MAG: hypothetical protein AAF628_18545 [Planctomycetota bacterium]